MADDFKRSENNRNSIQPDESGYAVIPATEVSALMDRIIADNIEALKELAK